MTGLDEINGPEMPWRANLKARKLDIFFPLP
jgi:hypothetical protein